MYASGATADNKDGPSIFLKTSGDTVTPQVFNNCSDFSIRFVEINGGWPTYSSDGIGINTNDPQFRAADYPDAWQQNILIEHNLVHNVEGEGLYIGTNYYDSPVPLRNIEIRRNRVENTNWDGIQMKSAVAGKNLIHDNVLRNVGSDSSVNGRGQIFGLSLLDGSGEIYNNYVERSGDTGIQHWIADLPSSFGPQSARIFNNVVVDAGVVGLTSRNGISVGSAAASRAGVATAPVLSMIYNNTIVRPRGNGVNVNSRAAPGGWVRDNIIVDAGSSPINALTSVSITNNVVGHASSLGFSDVAGLDFRLTQNSPARNSGSAEYPAFDFDNVARPQDGRADQGAFEYRAAGAPVPPDAPGQITVD